MFLHSTYWVLDVYLDMQMNAQIAVSAHQEENGPQIHLCLSEVNPVGDILFTSSARNRMETPNVF